MPGSRSQQCVIVGASHAGTQAALRLRKLGWSGLITVVGDEAEMPYHRPPLSKDYLKGNKTIDAIQLVAEANFARNEIDLRLATRATGIDRDNHRLLLESGNSVPYSRLILATGSTPRKLPVAGADLPGLHYLRSVADVDRIRRRCYTGQTRGYHRRRLHRSRSCGIAAFARDGRHVA